jgi:hypothetical protein
MPEESRKEGEENAAAPAGSTAESSANSLGAAAASGAATSGAAKIDSRLQAADIAARLSRSARKLLPPPSQAARAAMTRNLGSSLAPPPRAEDALPKQPPKAAPIGGTEMKRTDQATRARIEGQEESLEIDMGDGRVASRQNPINEGGKYIGKISRLEKRESAGNNQSIFQNQTVTKNEAAARHESLQEKSSAQKNEPAVLKPQARQLSANAARLIAKRRAMMEGQDQAGSFRLPGPDQTEPS